MVTGGLRPGITVDLQCITMAHLVVFFCDSDITRSQMEQLEGEAREELARSVARVSDIVLMVCEGDLNRSSGLMLQVRNTLSSVPTNLI